jgi:hypothetical protein
MKTLHVVERTHSCSLGDTVGGGEGRGTAHRALLFAAHEDGEAADNGDAEAHSQPAVTGHRTSEI